MDIFPLAIAGFAHTHDVWPVLTQLKNKGYRFVLEAIKIDCVTSYFLSVFWAFVSLLQS